MSNTGAGETSLNDGREFAWMWRAIRKHLGKIALIVMAACLTMTVYLLNRTKEYTAYADILIQPDSNDFGNLQEGRDQRPQSVTPADMESEVRLISSSHVVQSVMDQIELGADEPAFDVGSLLTGWIGASSARPDDPAARAASDTAKLKAFRKRLSIERDPLAYVITIGFRSKDPAKAALVVNKLADIYLADRVEAKRITLAKTADNLRRSVDDMGAWIKATEREIDNFRADSDLYAVSGTSPAELRYNTLSQQMTGVQLELTGAQSRLTQVETALDEGRPLDNLREVQTSQVIAALRNQESEIKRRIADLTTRLGDKHPVMADAKAELEDVQETIAREIDRVIGQIRSEASVARTRFLSIQAQVEAAQGDLASSQARRIRLSELEREAEAPRRVYETMLERYQQAREQEKILGDTARVIERARMPDRPSNMSGLLLLGLTGAGSCAAAVGAAFLVEARRQGYLDAPAIERHLGHPVIAMVPFVRADDGSKEAERWHHLEAYGFTEAVRSLVYTLLPKGGREELGTGKVVAVASSFPDEGKSTMALTLARQAGFSGLKTLLIEGDLRKPGFRTDLTTISAQYGLVHLLRQEKDDVFQCVGKEQESGVDIMPGFGPAKDSFKLLRGERMPQLLDAVRTHYDLIILDCAPVMAVSESRTLIELADEVLFVVRWQTTERSAAKVAVQDLERMGATLAGIVVNQVDLKEHLKYQEADRLAYQEKYQGYIQT